MVPDCRLPVSYNEQARLDSLIGISIHTLQPPLLARQSEAMTRRPRITCSIAARQSKHSTEKLIEKPCASPSRSFIDPTSITIEDPVSIFVYLSAFSLSLGRFWRRQVKFIKLPILKSLAEAVPDWPLPENRRRSLPGSNPETCRFRA